MIVCQRDLTEELKYPKLQPIVDSLKWSVSLKAPEIVKSLALGRTKRLRGGIDFNLPPMNSIDEMFEDICERASDLGLEGLLARLNGRPIRVGTMCSGTECPLMAFDLIQKRETDISFPSTFEED